MELGRIELAFQYEGEGLEEIRRCLQALYSTREGEQPLDRRFGISHSFLSLPLPVAESRFTLEVVEKTKRYEDRVFVEQVSFDYDETAGKMIPTIHFTGGEEA